MTHATAPRALVPAPSGAPRDPGSGSPFETVDVLGPKWPDDVVDQELVAVGSHTRRLYGLAAARA